ncbi:MAG: DMT family transporter [Paracoccaceae bacterium]
MTVPTPPISLDLAARNTLIGIACAMGGVTAFSINDMAIKELADDLALHQIILIRSIMGIVFLLAFMVWRGGLGQIRTRRIGGHAIRVSLVMVANVFFFLGLAALPLADGVAIGFVAPLFITVLSALVLRENVGPRRWAAVAVGLLGVLVMTRPGQGSIQPAALMILLSALAYACTHLMTRAMRDTESAATLNIYVQAGFVIVSLAVGLAVGDGRFAGSENPSLAFMFREWHWPAAQDWKFLILTGLATMVGGTAVAQAYRLCEASLIAPFEYVAMPMAIFWGYLVFGTLPDATGALGIALICGAGLYTLWRETRLRNRGRE